MIYLDANAIIPAVVNILEEDRTASARRLLKRNEVFHVSPLAEYEARKALHACSDEHWPGDLDRLFENTFTRLHGGWDAAILQALKLAKTFKSRLAVDSADTLHVGWALSIGADIFASFDRKSGPRALALCVGLKVWPAANEADYAEMRRLKTLKHPPGETPAG